MQAEVKIEDLPVRVKGHYADTRFRALNIATNYYQVSSAPINNIFIFKIIFTPKIMSDDRISRNKVLKDILPDLKTIIDNPIIGGMNIYSTNAPKSEESTFYSDGYIVNVKLVKNFDVKRNPKLLLQFLNNGLKNIVSNLGYSEIGRSGKFFNTKSGTKKDNLIVYEGYAANFLQKEAGFFLRVDTVNKVVQNLTVLEAINNIYRLRQELSRDEKRNLVKNQLVGKIVMTNYGMCRYYKVIDVQFLNLEEVVVSNLNITIDKYYKEKYGLTIKTNQPLLVIEQKKKNEGIIYMVPQLCLMTGIPEDLDEYKRKELSALSIKEPRVKKELINRFIRQIKQTHEVSSIGEMGIKISSKAQEINCKIIPTPGLQLGNNKAVQNGKQSMFNLFDQPIFSANHPLRVGILYSDRNSSFVKQLIETIEQTSKKLGNQLEIYKLCLGDLISDSAISKISGGVKQIVTEDCNIALIVLRPQLKHLYKKVKSICVNEIGISSQVVLEKSGKKNMKSIFTKILLQMLAKVGNILWVPRITTQMSKFMLISFDSSKVGGQGSIVGVGTASLNLASFFSDSKSFDNNNDKLQKMRQILLILLNRYLERNKFLPTEVIVLINSCAKDQINLFQEYFIQDALKELQKINASSLKLTVIMINTRTNERFFVQEKNQPILRNSPAGTLVANTIVSKNYDFYIVSQNSNKGTTVPNHYRVIFSNSATEEGILQQLIYTQCFNYVNWTGSIKVPGILQYAKKCARFHSEVLSGKEAKNLTNRLYYI